MCLSVDVIAVSVVSTSSLCHLSLVSGWKHTYSNSPCPYSTAYVCPSVCVWQPYRTMTLPCSCYQRTRRCRETDRTSTTSLHRDRHGIPDIA